MLFDIDLSNLRDLNSIPPLVLAYIGDAVFSLYVRTRSVCNKVRTVHNLHVDAIKYVKASSQAVVARKLFDELSDQEKLIFKRGRNAKAATIPKNADVQEYRYATAFEAVVGYIYLSNDKDRLIMLLERAIHIIENDIQ